MKILHVIPWITNKNLGKFYNQTIELVAEDDWICFLDGDAVHTTQYFGKYIEDVIRANKQYSLFTCRTNNIWHDNYQIYPGVDRSNFDLKYHRQIGLESWEKFGTSVQDITKSKPRLSGVFIAIKKESWNKVKGFKEDLMLGIDNDMHDRMDNSNLKVGLMLGIYVQHWYRGGDKNNMQHLYVKKSPFLT